MLGMFIQKHACVFLLFSRLRDGSPVYVIALLTREVNLWGVSERGIREKIRVELVERENKENDHAR